METGTILFALFLLSAGILLILLFRKGLKDRVLYQERMASAARTPRLSPSRARRSLASISPEQSPTW
jgi:uncharacterized iron-regulated membrane protein